MRDISIKGFTLIEMIAVMAILAILAATIAPSFIKDIDRAVGESEQVVLTTLAHELEIYITENKIIPDRNTWISAVASVASRNQTDITENKRFYTRRYYVDPRFFTSTDSVFSQYIQTSGLNAAPNSPRIIIASNLKGNLPNNLTTSSEFNAVWNQSGGATIVEGQDVKLERINLRGLFHRVLLTKDSSTPDPGNPGYQLESNGINSIASSSAIDIYLLKDTKVNLYQAPFTGNVIEKVFVANSSKNFNYQLDGSVWTWSAL